jgi:precorrin-3B C17-methyltransferase
LAGKLTLVGLGDGSLANLTLAAEAALKKATAIVGYRSYLNLVKKLGFNSQFYAFGMKQEQERALKALSLASQGEEVVLVCSGDAGIYGMAGLALELAQQKQVNVEITVLPGVTAALAVAAQLGAPLANDFAVISLSDLLTPWEKIKQRVKAAAAADFVLVFYNPMSSQRRWQFQEAVSLIKQYRSQETPVGIGKKTPNGEQIKIVTLAEAERLELDMHSLVIVGSSQTKQLGNWLVTERGYRLALASSEK